MELEKYWQDKPLKHANDNKIILNDNAGFIQPIKRGYFKCIYVKLFGCYVFELAFNIISKHRLKTIIEINGPRLRENAQNFLALLDTGFSERVNKQISMFLMKL
ncbi:MAG: hypothetical protein ACP5LM_05140 [Thermoplasmata archaeon]